MINWNSIFISGVLLASMSACSSTGSVNSGGGNVSRWIDTTGAEYVIGELKNDPRFAGSNVQLVHLDGDLITPEVSVFGDELKRQLFSAVLRERGVNLAVRPAVQPWRAQRTLAEVDCGFLKPVTHIIGMDIQSGSNGERLSLRSLDLRSNQWLSGFETSWIGLFDSNQKVSAGIDAKDVSLRGLRQFPFADDQSDLTASYLAQNLSCLLRQGAPERLKLYVKPNPYGTPAYFNTVNTLIGRYMNQYREVDVVDNIEGATAVVETDAVQIDNNLWQVWVGVSFVESGLKVSGADTPAYASLDPTSLFNSGKIVLSTRSEVADRPVRFPDPISAIGPVEGPSSVDNVRDSRASSADTISNNRANVADSSRLEISSFQALTPVAIDECTSENPWIDGERVIAVDEQLSSTSCFAIKANVSADAVYLILYTSEQQWYRLVGSKCQSPAFEDPSALAATGELRFPERATLGFSGSGNEETFYLIATRDSVSSAQIEEVISRLPDICGNSDGSIRSPMPQINALIARQSGGVVTKRLSVSRQRPS